jgi:homogentisate phytyltransferase / homogentisate geranylgeranyltransferase
VPVPPSVAVRARPRAVPAPAVLWRFGRPHTLIGTTVSVLGLTALAAAELRPDAGTLLFHLAFTLVAGIAVNVFIVGVNQVADVEIDRINKPELPIAAGELSAEAARVVCGACAALALALAVSQGPAETIAVTLGLAIGAAYSLEPLRLKRFPLAAALSITFVRSCVVNLGVWLHLSGAFGGGERLADVAPAVWALTAATLPFAFAIAVLKDVPDAEGDQRFGIRTWTVRLGQAAALRLGVAALLVATLGLGAAAVLLLPLGPGLALAAFQGGAAAWMWSGARAVRSREEVVGFYQAVWKLFFLEYVVVPAAFVAAS